MGDYTLWRGSLQDSKRRLPSGANQQLPAVIVGVGLDPTQAARSRLCYYNLSWRTPSARIELLAKQKAVTSL